MHTLERNLNHWFHLRRFDGWNLVFLMAMPFVSIILTLTVSNVWLYVIADACITIPIIFNDWRHLNANHAQKPPIICWLWLPLYMGVRELKNKGNIRLFYLFMVFYMIFFFVTFANNQPG